MDDDASHEEDRAVKRGDTRLSATGRTTTPGASAARGAVRPRVLARAVLALSLAAAVAGCSAMSPATVRTPYAPSDGVNVDLGEELFLRNVLVVGDAKGGQGAVVATIVNGGDQTATVALAAQLGESTPFGQTRVNVPANTSVLVGPGQQTEMVVSDMPVGPGEIIEMSAAAANAGTQYFNAPVLPPEGDYASLTAPPATATPTPTAAVTGGPTESPTESPTGEPTEEPTATP